eukprot:gene573-98_t
MAENRAPQLQSSMPVVDPNVVKPVDVLETSVPDQVLGLKTRPPVLQETVETMKMQVDSSAIHNASVNRVIAQQPVRQLDAIGISPDFYSSVTDWSSENIVSVVLNDVLYLWNGNTGETQKLCEQPGMSSVKFSDDGAHLAVGMENSEVQLWNVELSKIMRKLRNAHSSRVGCLSWNEFILSSGSRDQTVANSDVRVKEHLQSVYKKHEGEICGLAWSSDGKCLASGANDNTVCLWDAAMASKPRSVLTEHMAAVKAMAWCPFQPGVLATGGGTTCGRIKLWNVAQSRCMVTVDTYQQVTSLEWSATERELVSGHGPAGGMERSQENQITLWKYPSLTRITTMDCGGRVLGAKRSPDGCMLLTASDDELLRFWNVWPSYAPKKAKSATSSRRMI